MSSKMITPKLKISLFIVNLFVEMYAGSMYPYVPLRPEFRPSKTSSFDSPKSATYYTAIVKVNKPREFRCL